MFEICGSDALGEMYKGLLEEDRNTRYYRKYCATYDIVRKVWFAIARLHVP